MRPTDAGSSQSPVSTTRIRGSLFVRACVGRPRCGQRQQPRQRTWGSQTLATAVTALRVRRSRRRAISAGASLALRLRVLVTRGRLDRQIAVGRTCAPAATLALRARQLSDPRTRQRTAENLRGVVAYVDRLGSRPDFSAVAIQRAAVRAGREAILGLADRLERGAPVSPRGVVLARTLLADGVSSPIFNPDCGRTVAQAVWDIADVLEAEPPAF
jgi:hypothetical protein